MAQGFQEYVDCTSLLSDPAHLNQFYAENGYLFLRNVIEREAVARLAHEVLSAFRRMGLLDAAATPEHFRLSHLGVDDTPVYEAVDFDAIWQRSQQQALLERVMGEPVYVFRSQSLRFYPPGETTYVT
ncbi:MAG: hypothetical protein ABW110_09870, partial [Steroidobacteraceae bacterium]